jgi:hypothetical protein
MRPTACFCVRPTCAAETNRRSLCRPSPRRPTLTRWAPEMLLAVGSASDGHARPSAGSKQTRTDRTLTLVPFLPTVSLWLTLWRPSPSMAGASPTHRRRPRHPHGGVADLFPFSSLFLSSEYHRARRMRASVPLAGVAVRRRRGHRSCSIEWRSASPPSPFAPEGKPSSRQWRRGGAPPLPVFFV